jgi:hypothetical protein
MGDIYFMIFDIFFLDTILHRIYSRMIASGLVRLVGNGVAEEKLEQNCKKFQRFLIFVLDGWLVAKYHLASVPNVAGGQ